MVGVGVTLQAVDGGSGAPLWTATEQGAFLGRAASDGIRVYTGGGNGNAYAFDASTGKVVWSFATNDRSTAYLRFIFGPWYDQPVVLPGGLVMVSTVLDAFALDTATGAPHWSRSGSYIYAPTSVLDDGDLLMIDDYAPSAARVNAESGKQRWASGLGDRPINTGAVVDHGVAWIQGTTGLLVAVDIDSGETVEQLQLALPI